MSPLSVVGAMYMLAAGSAGETRRQILQAGLLFSAKMRSDLYLKDWKIQFQNIIQNFRYKSNYWSNSA